jgi:hypothetical protein
MTLIHILRPFRVSGQQKWPCCRPKEYLQSDEMVQEIMFIKAWYITNDSHGYFLLLSRKYFAYHASHTHLRTVAVLWSFGRSLYYGLHNVGYAVVVY